MIFGPHSTMQTPTDTDHTKFIQVSVAGGAFFAKEITLGHLLTIDVMQHIKVWKILMQSLPRGSFATHSPKKTSRQPGDYKNSLGHTR